MKPLLLFVLILISSACEEPCRCAHVNNIYPQHDTRAYVDMQCSNGKNEIASLHWSNHLYCDGKDYYIGDYIPRYGTKKFIH